MKIYFAGMRAPEWALYQMGVRRRLLSYYYLRSREGRRIMAFAARLQERHERKQRTR